MHKMRSFEFSPSRHVCLQSILRANGIREADFVGTPNSMLAMHIYLDVKSIHPLHQQTVLSTPLTIIHKHYFYS
ncbi:hypothetical protein BRADI_1g49145v3 [Brachypodium distachyon]|uniref:Uncharacterized protein n=1 Tax=Brachypodium distachyon TaxID=15368 RepID=A0A2K2DQG2_BRADI|nr:hypothetical protein BRADI_1g49145v3 [Brachypodium distachyon]